MRDFTREQLTSEAFWLAGGVVLHDAVLAPVVVALGYAASRVLPGHFAQLDGDGLRGVGHADGRVPAGAERSGRQARQRHDPRQAVRAELGRDDSRAGRRTPWAPPCGAARQTSSSDMKTLHGSGS